MQEKELQALLKKYLAGKCTPDEKAVLESWYLQYEPRGLKALSPEQMAEIQASAVHASRKPMIRPLIKWAAAAAILIALSVTIYVYSIREQGLSVAEMALKGDIPPGGNRAILTFGDGSRMDLSDRQHGITVYGDAVSYLDGAPVSNIDLTQKGVLSLSTPVGGHYRVVLPDGSTVWLNAASSLRYPSQFSDTGRVVQLEGEAFFDIEPSFDSSGDRIPFLVQTNNQTIQVLGTEFNVSAYADEAVEATTLVEGSVDVTAVESSARLQIVPGEQALVQERALVKQKANLEQVIAWKNGYFLFDNEPLSSVMHKISKWYDVDIVFEDPLENERFYGMITRDKRLSQVLTMLENTKAVRFSIKGNTLRIHQYKK